MLHNIHLNSTLQGRLEQILTDTYSSLVETMTTSSISVVSRVFSPFIMFLVLAIFSSKHYQSHYDTEVRKKY